MASLSEKEKIITGMKEIMKEKKITSKGKHIIKVMDQPLIVLIRLKYKGSKIIRIHNM